jgi:hypothetical protein
MEGQDNVNTKIAAMRLWWGTVGRTLFNKANPPKDKDKHDWRKVGF